MTNEVATIESYDEVSRQIAGLNNASSMLFATFDRSTPEGKNMLYRATNDSVNVSEHIDKVIELVHIAAMPVTLTDEKTGEQIPALRLILIDKSGKAYGSQSPSLYSAVQRLISIFGDPSTWSDPMKVKVVEQRSKNNAMYRFQNLILV